MWPLIGEYRGHLRPEGTRPPLIGSSDDQGGGEHDGGKAGCRAHQTAHCSHTFLPFPPTLDWHYLRCPKSR